MRHSASYARRARGALKVMMCAPLALQARGMITEVRYPKVLAELVLLAHGAHRLAPHEWTLASSVILAGGAIRKVSASWMVAPLAWRGSGMRQRGLQMLVLAVRAHSVSGATSQRHLLQVSVQAV